MNGSKESKGFVYFRDVTEVIDDMNLPSIIRDRLTRSLDELSPADMLENLSEEQRENLEEHIKVELKDDLRREFKQEYSEEFDVYLGEVVRRLYGHSLSELSPDERRDIEDIRKQLKIPGRFNPDA